MHNKYGFNNLITVLLSCYLVTFLYIAIRVIASYTLKTNNKNYAAEADPNAIAMRNKGSCQANYDGGIAQCGAGTVHPDEDRCAGGLHGLLPG